MIRQNIMPFLCGIDRVYDARVQWEAELRTAMASGMTGWHNLSVELDNGAIRHVFVNSVSRDHGQRNRTGTRN